MPVRAGLVIDANVLIDYATTDESVLALAARHFGRFIVPLPVLDEVELLDAVAYERLGIEVVEPTLEQLLEAGAERGRLSFEDRLCLVVARDAGWLCVTNDRRLRPHVARRPFRSCGASSSSLSSCLPDSSRPIRPSQSRRSCIASARATSPPTSWPTSAAASTSGPRASLQPRASSGAVTSPLGAPAEERRAGHEGGSRAYRTPVLVSAKSPSQSPYSYQLFERCASRLSMVLITRARARTASESSTYNRAAPT